MNFRNEEFGEGTGWRMEAMKRNSRIIAAVLVAILLLPFLLRKKTALLGMQGGKKIVARRSIIPDLRDGEVGVYVGDEKVFSLWEDWCDGPLFIYPFGDGRRFFCDYNYDTAILDFVVDLDPSHTNLTVNWPANHEVRKYLAQSATNVAYDTKGMIRLPTDEELDEVRDYLARTSARKINDSSIPYTDFGIRHGYARREFLLLDIATNRQNHWPLPGVP